MRARFALTCADPMSASAPLINPLLASVVGLLVICAGALVVVVAVAKYCIRLRRRAKATRFGQYLDQPESFTCHRLHLHIIITYWFLPWLIVMGCWSYVTVATDPGHTRCITRVECEYVGHAPMVTWLTGQFADKPTCGQSVADWSTRRLVNSPTANLKKMTQRL